MYTDSFFTGILSNSLGHTSSICCAEQEEQQSGKALDVGAAVNSMLMQIAKDKLAANIRDLAAAAMQLAAAQGAAREAAAAATAAAQEAGAST